MSAAPEPAGHERLLRTLSMLFLVWLLGLLGVVAAVSSLTRMQWRVALVLEAVVTVALFGGLLVLRRLRRRDARRQSDEVEVDVRDEPDPPNGPDQADGPTA